ncbi:LuxR C-terminal-related transcriptional regulator [Paenibacillus hexagrammi]|uniref:Response regulator transcription factor n=1 Tax=Paenibacillus hexagrammi TaxID=2908839 RepID=A0ABY3SCY3_9BACL|nr:response regulator transcription factor [Paenibacillus sp. YPD9-1]UJF31849.1 response regulator transcription factor [Paenibacillus sp. YPD9-1]
MVKVILADHQRLVCEGIKFILEKDVEIQVEGYALNEGDALMLCRQIKPHVLILDFHSPQGDCFELVAHVFSHFPATNIIILTSSWDAHTFFQALRNGVSGYLPKSIQSSELIMSVKSAALGLRVLHKEMPNELFGRFKPRTTLEWKRSILKNNEITEREIRIIRYVAEGKENSEIAASMFLSVGTVKNTISLIFKKLGLKDRIELAVFATKNDLNGMD